MQLVEFNLSGLSINNNYTIFYAAINMNPVYSYTTSVNKVNFNSPMFEIIFGNII